MRQDIAYALRQLRANAAFAVIAVLTLSLGIGATTAIFSLANWTLFRPVAGVHDPDRVHVVWSGRWRSPGGPFTVSFVSYPNFNDISGRLKTIAALGGYQSSSVVVAPAVGDTPRVVPAQFVSASYFDVLGVSTRIGRPFTKGEDEGTPGAQVAVISDRLWETMFARDAQVLQRTVRVNGQPFQIIGVATPGFLGHQRVETADMWMPGSAAATVRYQKGWRADSRTTSAFYMFVARLAPGATWAQAEAELQALGPWLLAQHPEENERYKTVGFHHMGPIGGPAMAAARQRLQALLLVMLGASALVLLIACSNVASLLTMRGIARQGEMAIRKSLGAAASRLIRQQLTEASILWIAGGAAGLLVAWTLTRVVQAAALVGGRVTNVAVPIDWRVVAFTALLSLVVGLIFSILPSVRVVRIDAARTLQRTATPGARRTVGAGSLLAAVQIAASLTLLVGALLLAATLRNLQRVELGFTPDRVTAFNVDPARFGYTPAAASAYRLEFARRLASTPGVEAVAAAQGAPFASSWSGTRVRRQGRLEKADTHETLFNALYTPGYFSLMEIPIVRGRVFTDADLAAPGRRSRQVVVLSEGLARTLFAHENPIGQLVEMPVLGREKQTYEVIGVVGDARFLSLTGDPEPTLYEPAGMHGEPRPDAMLIVRTSTDRSIAAEIRSIATAIDPAQPVSLLTPLRQGIATQRRDWDMLGRQIGVLAFVACVLSGVGIYGVIAFGVAARRHEFGVRMALGAAPRRIVRLVLRRTAIITAVGLAAGAGGAVALARTIESRLVGVQPFDPLIWSAAAALLVMLALAASIMPVRRAMHVDLTETLRA